MTASPATSWVELRGWLEGCAAVVRAGVRGLQAGLAVPSRDWSAGVRGLHTGLAVLVRGSQVGFPGASQGWSGGARGRGRETARDYDEGPWVDYSSMVVVSPRGLWPFFWLLKLCKKITSKEVNINYSSVTDLHKKNFGRTLGQNFFILMQFLRNFYRIISWRHLLWGWRPNLGNPRSAPAVKHVIMCMPNEIPNRDPGANQGFLLEEGATTPIVPPTVLWH